MVWWDDDAKTVTILELTVPYDTLMEEAMEQKTSKYTDLHEVQSLRVSGLPY